MMTAISLGVILNPLNSSMVAVALVDLERARPGDVAGNRSNDEAEPGIYARFVPNEPFRGARSARFAPNERIQLEPLNSGRARSAIRRAASAISLSGSSSGSPPRLNPTAALSVPPSR